MQGVSTSTAYDQLVALRVIHTGEPDLEIRKSISQAEFEAQLRDLHQHYMDGEFTIGRLADLLGVPSLNLVDILDEAGLPMRYE